MDFVETLLSPQGLISILAAVAVFATIITLTMPLLQSDQLGSRMKTVATEREKIRARERARLLEQQKNGNLKQSNEGWMQSLVDRYNLKKSFIDDKTVSQLQMGGFRQQSHVTVFIILKIFMPLGFLLFALFYLFVASKVERPVMVNITISVVVAAIGFYLPTLLLKNKITKRQLSIKRAWPDCLDLLLICVESGMSLEAALKKVAHEIGLQSAELAEELTLTTAELSYLQERRQAHENFANRTGLEQVKAVSMALIQSEKYGTPLSTALRALSQESRDIRMNEAEKKAASLPPKLTVPMIVFFLPVLFVVIMGPAMMKVFG